MRLVTLTAVATALAALGISGCSSEPDPQASSQAAESSQFSGLLRKIADSGEITVVTTNNPPFSYVTATDKNVRGVGRDILDGFLNSQGLQNVKVNTMLLPFDDSIPAIQAGKADMILDNFYVRPEREQVVDFTDPVIMIPEGLVVPKGNPENIHELTEACGKKVGVLNGASTEQVVENAAAKCPAGQTIDMTAYKTYQAAVSDVALGRINAALYDAGTVAYALSQNPNQDYEMVSDYRPALPGTAAFIFQKGVQGILPQFNAYLEKIRTDGTEKAMFEKHGFTPADAFLPPSDK
jgi:polar amino acid transport system substrate-binding protein